jgi:asparagine synthase (glutamine-hydrolysing)
MCGICGKLLWEVSPERSVLEAMTHEMRNRGPDAHGTIIKGPIGLGHCRLSIIDLSPEANQPMFDCSGLFVIVYNGEIYNFQELRDELRGQGVVFRTRTDTEVVLESYKAWGTRCLERFNGMFAFAIWSEIEQSLFLARDRLGEKPLYYIPLTDGGLLFASEIKAIEKDPQFKGRLNFKAFSHFLSLGYTLTSDCILRDVKKLEAGHFLIAKRGKVLVTKKYWDLASYFYNKRKYRNESEAAEELNGLLNDAVRLRLISDVPLGAFLSGGIDSSAITASMCGLRSPDENLTFSMGFKEKSYDETTEAKTVAHALGTRHFDKLVESDILSNLSKIAYCTDEPLADTSIIPMYYLAEFARERVKVCLSGDGGDEIFGGYETYVADRIHHATQVLPGWLIKCASKGVNRFWPVSFDKVSFDYKLRKFLNGCSLPIARAHYSWRTLFTEMEKRELLNEDLHPLLDNADPFNQFEKYRRDVDGCHYLDQAMYVDIKTWLVDDILVKVDRSTMAHSLETRAPFLDHRMVEFAASLPVGLKQRGLGGKYLLKKSQRSHLPASVLRRSKKGFNAPVSHWFGSSLGSLLERLLQDRTNNLDMCFQRDAIKKLLDQHLHMRCDNGLKLFCVTMFLLWNNARVKASYG